MARIVPISFTRCSVAITIALLMMTSAMAKKMTTAVKRTTRSSVTNCPTSPAACCQSTTLSPSPALPDRRAHVALGAAELARVVQDERRVERDAALDLLLRVDARREVRRARPVRLSPSHERALVDLGGARLADERRAAAPEQLRLRSSRVDLARPDRRLQPRISAAFSAVR